MIRSRQLPHIHIDPMITAAILVIGTTACGSRSGLYDSGPGGGAGHQGSAGGNGGAPRGGTAGTCSGLLPLSPVLAIEKDAQSLDHDSHLAQSNDDGNVVAAVWVRLLTNPTASVLHHTSIHPWAEWPQSGTIGPAFSSSLIAWDAVAVTSGVGGGYAAALPNPPVTLVATGIDPSHAGSGPGAVTLVQGDGAPLFIAPHAAAPPAHLVGVLDQSHKILVTVVPSTGPPAGPATIGCALTMPPLADALPHADGWLAAVSSAEPFGTCSDATKVPSYPTRIDIVRIGRDASVSLVASIDNGDKFITQLRTTAHSDGMYVVWRDSAIHAARITDAVVAGPLEIFAQHDGVRFTAATMEDRLVVSRVAHLPRRLAVTMYDESLSQIAEGELPSEEPLHDPDSALASPDGRSLLVSFHQEPYAHTVQIVRFDCVD